MNNVQEGLGVKNYSDLVRKKYKVFLRLKILQKSKSENTKELKKKIDPESNSKSRFARSDLMEKVIKNCRGIKRCIDGINRIGKEEQREKFRTLLGFRENDMMLTKEQSVLKLIMDAFEGENMQTQYSVLGYKIDLYFHGYKLAIEVDEKGHKDRNIDLEIKNKKQ